MFSVKTPWFGDTHFYKGQTGLPVLQAAGPAWCLVSSKGLCPWTAMAVTGGRSMEAAPTGSSRLSAPSRGWLCLLCSFVWRPVVLAEREEVGRKEEKGEGGGRGMVKREERSTRSKNERVFSSTGCTTGRHRFSGLPRTGACRACPVSGRRGFVCRVRPRRSAASQGGRAAFPARGLCQEAGSRARAGALGLHGRCQQWPRARVGQRA